MSELVLVLPFLQVWNDDRSALENLALPVLGAVAYAGALLGFGIHAVRSFRRRSGAGKRQEPGGDGEER